jgi:hypothetical protein
VYQDLGIELQVSCQYLFDELRFRKTKEAYHPEAFGNAFVILQSAHFQVRFVRERGDLFMDVGSLTEPARWWSLEWVAQLIGRPFAKTVEGREGAAELIRLAHFLKENYVAISQCFSPERIQHTEQQLQAMTQAWSARTFSH